MNLIENIIEKRGITRICHFTKAKNLPHVFNDFGGILSTDKLPDKYKDVNDFSRYDGKTDFICCSIQYPNIFYLNNIKNKDLLFKDWVILTIDPKVMAKEGVLFSKVNAATERGKYIKSGYNALNGLFEQSVQSSKRIITRSMLMPENCTTDNQAEVLIPEFIAKENITSIIVPNVKRAKEESLKLRVLGINLSIPIIISEDLFEKKLADMIRSGNIPNENIF